MTLHDHFDSSTTSIVEPGDLETAKAYVAEKLKDPIEPILCDLLELASEKFTLNQEQREALQNYATSVS